MKLMGMEAQAQPAPADMLSFVAALKSDATTLRDRYAPLCVNILPAFVAVNLHEVTVSLHDVYTKQCMFGRITTAA